MISSPQQQSSVWFFYSVAAALGLSFSAALMTMAWNNAVGSATRAFAFELVSFEEAARTQAQAADATLDGTARFLGASADALPSSTVFAAYCADALSAQPYLRRLTWYRIQDRTLVRFQHCGDPNARELPATLPLDASDSTAADLRSALELNSSLPISLAEDVTAPAGYTLARRIVGSGSTASPLLGMVMVTLDGQALLGSKVADAALSYDFLLESEGLGGRRLLVRKPKATAGGALKILEDSNQIRFDRYSLRLQASRDLHWSDLDKPLLATGLILSIGVTLLLIALARAKDLQMRELAARNRVIEEQVNRQTYELSLARDEALTASKVKSDFLASMSHEIRTPLNAIIGMAELLGDTALNSEQTRYVGVFKNAGEALLSLVNDILDLSKIEAGQLSLEAIDFDLRDLFEQAADIYALKTSAKGLELAVNIAPEVPEALVGDPARLRQILLNLLGNAVKFTERGEILLGAEVIAQSVQQATLRFFVKDSGIGIPSSKLESIFENFTQVDSSTTRRFGGTGLGLAISKRLAEMMGGKIWAESTLGVGSRFVTEVTLPIGTVNQTLAAEPPKVAGKSVLIVDDNSTNRLILAQTLGRAGARVVEAETGREALRACAAKVPEGGFDIVLCDSQMPEMDGFSAVELMLQEGINARRVLMLTSSNLVEDVARARQLNLGGYLVKPVKRKDLYFALGKILTEESADVAKRSAETRKAPTRRILLAEDNADNRLLVRAYLKNEPYEVTEVEDGAAAVTRCAEEQFDLVLMDIQMPIMDGHEATRAIRLRETTLGLQAMPIIALTAHAVKEEIDRSLLAGCTAHMTKPIKKKTLLDMLDQQWASA